MTKPAAVISIAGREIGFGHPPYVVAEMSANHHGELETALRMIEVAKECGADAIKLQTYRPGSLTIDSDKPGFMLESGPWQGRTLFDLYSEAQTPWEWHRPLFRKAEEIGITVFSSPFDLEGVQLLESLSCPAYKIASFEIVDHALIEAAARTGRPVILSTGMATDEEVGDALSAGERGGAREIVLLHAISGYPTPPSEANLPRLDSLRTQFGRVVGISDHTPGIGVAIGAVAIGAALIEKHFILDRNSGGPDAFFSLEPSEFRDLCQGCKDAWTALAPAQEPASSEMPSKQIRRSLYVVKDVSRGERFTEENVRSIRPGFGLEPKHLSRVIGRTAARDVPRGTPFSEDLIDT